MDCFALALAVKGFWRRFYPYRDPTIMPCSEPHQGRNSCPWLPLKGWYGRTLAWVTGQVVGWCMCAPCFTFALILKQLFFVRWRSQKVSGGLGWFCCVCLFVFLIKSLKFFYLCSLACYCSIDHLYTLLPPRPRWCNFWGKWILLCGRDGNLDQLYFLDKELLDLDKGLQNQNEMKSETLQRRFETYTESIWTRSPR